MIDEKNRSQLDELRQLPYALTNCESLQLNENKSIKDQILCESLRCIVLLLDALLSNSSDRTNLNYKSRTILYNIVMGYYILTVILSSFIAIEGRNDDVFSYGNENTIDYGPNGSGVRSFGQPNWGDVTCSDRNTCVSMTERHNTEVSFVSPI